MGIILAAAMLLEALQPGAAFASGSGSTSAAVQPGTAAESSAAAAASPEGGASSAGTVENGRNADAKGTGGAAADAVDQKDSGTHAADTMNRKDSGTSAADTGDGAEKAPAESGAADGKVYMPDNSAAVKADGKDFTSCRLLVSLGDGASIRDGDAVLAEYDGLSLLAFDSAEETETAYDYYSGVSDFAEPDIAFSVQDTGGAAGNAGGGDGATVPDAYTNPEAGLSENENPLAALAAEEEAEVAESEGNETETGKTGFTESPDAEPAEESGGRAAERKTDKDDGLLVALLDSGVPENDASVTDAVSLVDDSPWDENGHGTAMLEAMKAQNPDVKVLSVKVLDKDGRGSVSSVYAGIRYSIDHGAGIISLSLAAVSSEQSRVIADVINEAINAGITVVASAGNGGYNTKYFIPANIDGVLTIGACDEDGKRLGSSNFGKAVDYLMPASSTSDAAAAASGWLSRSAEGTAEERIKDFLAFPFKKTEDGETVYGKDGLPEFEPLWFLPQDEEKTDDGKAPEIDYDDGKPFRMQRQFFYIKDNNPSSGNYGQYLVHHYEDDAVGKSQAALVTDLTPYEKPYQADHTDHTVWYVSNSNPAELVNASGYVLMVKAGVGNAMAEIDSDFESRLLADGYTYAVLECLDAAGGGNEYYLSGIDSNMVLEAVTAAGHGNYDLTHADALDNNMAVGVYFKDRDTDADLGYHIITAGIFEDMLGKARTLSPEQITGYTVETGSAGPVTLYGRADTPADTPVGSRLFSGATLYYTRNKASFTLETEGRGTADVTVGGTLAASGTDAFSGTYYPATDYTKSETRTTTSYTGTDADGNSYAAGNGTDVLSISAKEAGDRIKVDNVKPADGYYYAGMTVTEGASVSSAAGDSVEKELTQDGLSITLIFKRKYTIDYVKGGGTSATPLPEEYAPTDADFTIPSLTKTGYAFLGWTAGDAATEAATGVSQDHAKAQKTVTVKKGTAQDLTFRALWKPDHPGKFVDEETGELPVLTADEKNKGKYRIVEIHSSPGYINRYQEQEIEVNGKDQTVTFSDDKNKLVIKKVDDKGKLLPGTKFKVWHVDTSASDHGESKAEERVTGADGTITLLGLDPGTWGIQETEVQKGSDYYPDPTIYYVSVDKDGLITNPATGKKVDTVVTNADGKTAENPVEITVVNKKDEQPVQWHIQKRDADGNPVEGAEFTVSLKGGSWSAKATTGADGLITIGKNGDGTGQTYDINRGMKAGETYTYKETEAPEGYVKDGTTHTFTVNEVTGQNGKKSLQVSDPGGGIVIDKKMTVKISKTDDFLGEAVIGAGFEITDPDGRTATLYTESDSSAAGDGADTGASITLPDGESFTTLTEGEWTYQEVSVPAKYGLTVDSTVRHFTVNSDGTVTGNDGKKYSSGDIIGTVEDRHVEVKLQKKDAGTGDMLAGAYIRVWGADSAARGFDQTASTKDYGKKGAYWVFLNTYNKAQKQYTFLVPGTYYYQEVFAPSGYVLDSTVRSFSINEKGIVSPSDTLTIEDQPNALTILKKDENGNAVPGVTFHIGYEAVTAEIPLSNGRSTSYTYTSILNGTGDYTTGEDGKISFEKLPAGTYTVTEKSVPDTVIPDTTPHTFTVGTDGKITGTDDGSVAFSGSGTGSVTMAVTDKAPGWAELRIAKEDETTKEKLKGAEFYAYPYKDGTSWDGTKGVKIDNADWDEAAGEYVKTLSSDAAYGGRWHIAETKRPDGYAGTFETDITIENNGKTETVNIPAENTPNSLTIKKVDADTGKALAGAVFRVWADGSSEDDGRTLTAGPDGTASLGKIADGTYHYKETEAPAGYRITDTGTHGFTVTDGLIYTEDDPKNGKTAVTLTVEDRADAPRYGRITLTKKDSGGTVIDGGAFVFNVYEYNTASKSYSSAAACTLTYDSDSKTWDSESLGITDANGGRYKVVEEKAAPGYIADYQQEVRFDKDGSIIQTKSLTAVNRENRLSVKKTDTAGKALTGAVFTLTRVVDGVNAEEIRPASAGGAWTYYGTLPEGSYVLRETQAPDHYSIWAGTVNITVDASGNIRAEKTAGDTAVTITGSGTSRSCTVTVADKESSGPYVLVYKEDDHGNPLPGVEFTLYKVTGTYGSLSETKVGDPKTTADPDGSVTFTGLERSAAYVIRETSASVKDRDGNELIPDFEKYFITDADGKIEGWSGAYTENGSLEGDGNPVSAFVLTAVNGPAGKTGTVSVKKVDGDGNALENASFAVYQWDTSLNGGAGGYNTDYTVSVLAYDRTEEEYVSGTLVYSGTNQGRFKVVEEKPPAGYAYKDTENPSSEKWEKEFVIDPDKKKAQEFTFTAVNVKQWIGTTAHVTGSSGRTAAAADVASLTDTVAYHNLETGQAVYADVDGNSERYDSYTLTGLLVDKAKAEEWLAANGKASLSPEDAWFPNGDISKDTDGNPRPTEAPSYYSDTARDFWEYASVKDADGQPLRVYRTFSAASDDGAHLADGTLDMEFTFDSRTLLGTEPYKDVVVFEQLATTDGLVLAASHSDLTDARQTVRLMNPEIHTALTDTATGIHGLMTVRAGDGGTRTAALTDTVAYLRLITGEEYTLKGTLMDAETGNPVKGADGKDVTGTKTFTAKTADGTEKVTFTFTVPESLYGHRVVAYEELVYKGGTVAFHRDMDDALQAMTVPSEVSIIKKNRAGKTLAGAVFGIYTKDGDSYSPVLKDGNGHLFIKTGEGASASGLSWKYDDTAGKWTSVKTDKGTYEKALEAMQDAEKGAYTAYTEGPSGSDGRVDFRNLPVGTYYIKEVKAPDGYALLAEYFEAGAVSGKRAEYTVTDHKPYTLYTGGPGRAGVIIPILAIIAAEAFVWFRRKRRCDA